MFSEELSKTLNSFYGEDDKLINSKFSTDEQICSFLSGVYYRYGKRLDSSIYKIQMANSPKHQNCYDLLKRIGCEKIFYKYLRNIPAQSILYFEPSEDLKDYFGLIELEKIIVNESFYDQRAKKKKGNKISKELENDLIRLREKETEKIKCIFEN